MKKYILIFSLMFIGFNAHSQVLISLLFGDALNSDGLEFGLEAGVNFSDISGLDADKRLSLFNLGFYFDIKLKEPWYLYTGVMVKSKSGTSNLSESDLNFLDVTIYNEPGTYSQELVNFLVPVLAKYKFKNRMYVEAGPQIGMTYKSWVQFDSDVDDGDARIREYNKDDINRFDVGMMAGVGYSLLNTMGMTFGAKFYYGFVDVYKDMEGTKNNSIVLKANIPIGAGKAKLKK